MADNAVDPLQKEEWEVIESIYPDYISQSLDESGSFKLELPVEFPEARTIQVLAEGEGCTNTTREESLSLSLFTLPPLLLHIVLPPTYPTRESPSLLAIRATHLWLQRGQIVQLQKRMMDMWTEGQGQGVLYTWIEYLHSGEFLKHVQGDSIQIHHPSPRNLASLLQDHQIRSVSDTFNETSYSCSICLEYFKGSKCLQLTCTHIFCRKCLGDFWGLCIKEGDIDRVRCPDPECVKSGKDATEEEVARVVSGGEEELKRWKWLKQKAAMEKDPSILHCPMSFCQNPVPKPRAVEGQEESRWDRLRTCTECSYSFCALCRRTWHGPVSSCPVSSSRALVLEYLALSEDSPERMTMERRYGRNILVRLVDKYCEEQANRKWIKLWTTTCPGCGVNVEKSLGCNHMTCTKCQAHFCYMCGQKVEPTNPFQHFNTEGGPCYRKLFDYDHEVDMDDWEFEGWDNL